VRLPVQTEKVSFEPLFRDNLSSDLQSAARSDNSAEYRRFTQTVVGGSLAIHAVFSLRTHPSVTFRRICLYIQNHGDDYFQFGEYAASISVSMFKQG
jgi:hypothetical protein